MYYLLAVLMGAMIVIIPVLNGQLTLKVGTYKTSLLSYGIGCIVSLLLVLIFDVRNINLTYFSIPLYKYIGFVFGVFVILIFNKVSSKVPAIYIVLLPFIGQTLMSSVVDYYLYDAFNIKKLIGVVLIFTGVLVNEK